MTRRRPILMAVLVVSATTARAQLAPRTDCPVAKGLVIQTSTDSVRVNPKGSASGGLHIDSRQAIDTTWTFDIAERRWTRPYFSALIGAGWASDAHGTGTTSAPDSLAARGWSACAGARIDMRDPTLVLRGARGRVHLRADVRSLSIPGQSSSDTTSHPRRER